MELKLILLRCMYYVACRALHVLVYYAFEHVELVPNEIHFLYRKQYFVVLSPGNPSSASIEYCDRRNRPCNRRFISVLPIISILLDRFGIGGSTGRDGVDVGVIAVRVGLAGGDSRFSRLILSTISSSDSLVVSLALMTGMIRPRETDGFNFYQ